MQENDRDIGRRLLDPYSLMSQQVIGKGAFGVVTLMKDPKDNKVYAVKTESETSSVPQLAYEFKVYKKLRGTPGVPLAYALWNMDGKVCMAMQPLGPSLERVIKSVTLWDVTQWLFPKALNAVESVHRQMFIHRDIKPENLLLGPSGLDSQEVYLVDFGLSKRYRMGDQDHIPYREGKRLTGTVRYASIHTHLGEEQSRRDDLESLGYVMVYLVKRHLPWMGSGGKDKNEMHRRIMECKVRTTVEALTEGLPTCFQQYFRCVRSLSFDATPDYDLLKSFFRANLES